MFKEYMIDCLHVLYRSDEWVNELYESIGSYAETTAERINVPYNNLYFDTLNEYGCEIFEKDLGITPLYNATLEQRRTAIKSKWLAKSFCNLPLLQSIADSQFGAGKVTVDYSGDAKLHYIGNIGFNHFDIDTSNFIKAVDEVKPAHFDYDWSYIHNVWRTYHDPMIWGIFANETWANRSSKNWDTYTVALKNKKWSYCVNRTWKEMMYKEVIY